MRRDQYRQPSAADKRHMLGIHGEVSDTFSNHLIEAFLKTWSSACIDVARHLQRGNAVVDRLIDLTGLETLYGLGD